MLLGVLAAAFLLFLMTGAYRLAFLTALAGAGAVFFFRNPERIPAEQDALAVIAPVDGRVEEIALKDDGVAVRIFNAPFDGHLLRMPLQGKIKTLKRRAGLTAVFGSALDRLGHLEQVSLESAAGLEGVELHLVPEVTQPVLYGTAHRFHLGQRIGFFHGGRVMLLLPRQVELKIAIGDRVLAGESIIGFARIDA